MNLKKLLSIGLVLLLSTLCFAASTDYKVTNDGDIYMHDGHVAGDLYVTGTISDLITKSPWVDVRAFMDGVAGRPTYATWYSNQATTDVATVLSAFFTASLGKMMVMPPGIYCSSTAQNWPGSNTTLIGVRGASIIRFTGATDGLVLPDMSPQLENSVIDGITIQTSNAVGGKAINADFTTNSAGFLTLRDISIKVSGSGRWTHGLYAINFQSSNIYDLNIYFSAVTGIYLGTSCNSLRFYGTEINGQTWTERGIDIANSGSSAATWWFGGTVQSYFTASAIRVNPGAPRFFGMHIENSTALPSDGADIVVGTSATSYKASFNAVQGGNYLLGATGIEVTNITLNECETTGVILGNNSHDNSILNSRIQTYTDSGARNRRIGCSTTSRVTLVDILSDLFPSVDNTYYLGKNDDDTPFAWAGAIFKDTTNGKYYRVEVINGMITATDLTD